ncbi:unnamed protein product [Paramecium sonneborni]|uniref:Uncharacterized protein n=1 Tax=Paramecium sonneborni TaxID=65129 RepID=A0A8S1PYQ3_9CILI|nr:unnamed protein product [Paramecium sonneborni]
MKHEKYIYSKLESVEIIQTQEIVSNVYQLIALHQIEDIIQIYYLNVEELILLYEYNVAMAKILRPFKYSINQNYLIIAANIQEKQFLLTFAIFKNKNLKLIKTIEISSLKFLLENNYLYYFDKSNNFRVYNIEYFEVTLKNLIPKQKDFLHIQQFSFEIFLVDSNESYMKISFFLMKSNQCYQLFPIQNQIQLQLNNRNFLRIKLDELFLGQIYNLTSLQNNNTYLNGPFLLQEKISNYKQHYTIKIRTIYLQQTNNLSELQKKTKIYLIHLESGIEVVKNYEEIKKYFQIEYGMFLDMFCENEYFLQVLFLTNQNDLQVIKFLIKDNYLILDEQQLVIQQNINLNFYNQVLKIGKLIALNSDSNPYLYYLTEQTIKSLENQKEFEKIIFIKNANDLYLTTQNYFQEQYWQIQILVLKTQKLEIFLQRLIDIDLIFQELKKSGSY